MAATTLYDANHEQVYCYTRTLEKEGIVVILNFLFQTWSITKFLKGSGLRIMSHSSITIQLFNRKNTS